MRGSLNCSNASRPAEISLKGQCREIVDPFATHCILTHSILFNTFGLLPVPPFFRVILFLPFLPVFPSDYFPAFLSCLYLFYFIFRSVSSAVFSFGFTFIFHSAFPTDFSPDLPFCHRLLSFLICCSFPSHFPFYPSIWLFPFLFLNIFLLLSICLFVLFSLRFPCALHLCINFQLNK